MMGVRAHVVAMARAIMMGARTWLRWLVLNRARVLELSRPTRLDRPGQSIHEI